MRCSRIVTITLCAFATAASSARADAGWTMYNHDVSGSRAAPDDDAIDVNAARRLRVLWEAPARAMVTGTPLQLGSFVYAGDYAGWFRALDARTGALRWERQMPGGAPISATAAIVGDLVIFGDQGGTVHALDRRTGESRWSRRYDDHPMSAVWGSPTPIGRGLVAIGLSTNEEFASGTEGYPCCSARGAVVLFRAADGAVVWQTYMVDPGESGASVWSTPTYDPELQLLFVTTGNNYSQPATPTSDAIVALNVSDGSFAWVNQRWPDDTWSFVDPDSPDYDFGDSAQIYRLADGRKVVGAGQKSGYYHVLDAATGAEIAKERYEIGGILGGLFADSAYAGGVVFANTAQWAFDAASGTPLPLGGSLVAFSGDARRTLWRFVTPGPNNSGVAVAGGVIYFSSTLDGLYALDASTGELLSATYAGFSVSGPSVAGGRVCAGTGTIDEAGTGGVVCLAP